MKFYNMAEKPLKYDVCCGKTVVIPAGTTNVKIAFRASHLYRIDENGQQQKLNVYIHKGNIYHA